MGRRIVGIAVLLAILIGGYTLWKHHGDTQELANGDVHCEGCMTPEEHARFLKENAGETADGASDQKNKTARQEAATGFQDAANTMASGGDPASAAGAGRPQRVLGQAQPVQLPPSAAFTLAANAGTPDSDTLPPNSQNGSRFGGTGPFQWYRQGNLTWRVDTVTGRSCIIYATLEEWRKQIVFSHGCGPNA